LRPLFEVLLAFSLGSTSPTEVLEALWALNVRAWTVLDHLNVSPAVGTLSGAVLDVKVREHLFGLLVAFQYVRDAFDLSKLLIVIYPVKLAALERVIAVTAAKTEHELTVVALAHVELLVFGGKRVAAWQRTGSHVVHLVDGLLEGHALVLLCYLLVETHLMDVLKVDRSLALGI
jgi:hypothetical protein